MLLKALRLEGIPNFNGSGTCSKLLNIIIINMAVYCVVLSSVAPSFVVRQYKTKIYSSKLYEVGLILNITSCISVTASVVV